MDQSATAGFFENRHKDAVELELGLNPDYLRANYPPAYVERDECPPKTILPLTGTRGLHVCKPPSEQRRVWTFSGIFSRLCWFSGILRLGTGRFDLLSFCLV